ncbi:tRNA threonylcarbamoyladenosine biosynthesis protein [Fervidicella metallireducens AeB]|uniref:Threonylcarbamoyl-AMP synthase n=1 Tax=Fervidicella metallireducens AeB TaxID=1403537 RepID=A0A017RYQ7_9CLOT|nr:L-threonylcarbamoyladenylate synthase [Fervidicella metallireducens]EYE89817.1 tRNA threonylcarbamoyladenosine biosynthesis protein [Fervidicella metallireducens AeB]
MNTKVYYIDEHDTDKIKEAAEIIASGGTVVFPTETVYGLGANALDEKACEKIFTAKGRPQDNPLIVHVADFDLSKYVTDISENAKKLMEAFWPGPLTIIMPKKDIVPLTTTGGLDSVAIRMPSNKIARKLIEFSGVPIAAPSANISGRPSPTTIEHCINDLTGKVDMIIGGEKCDVGLESTVVDTTGDEVVILRPGGITKEMLEEVVGNVSIDPAIMEKASEGLRPKSPGMKYRHYAPKAPLTIIKGDLNNVIKYVNEKTDELSNYGYKVGVMATDETIKKYNANIKISVGDRKESGIIAANLFDVLREFDKIDVDYIYAEGFSEEGLGLAIMNRLKKAAGYNVIEV